MRKKRSPQGGSLTGSRHTQIGNRPEAKLFATRHHLLKYAAIHSGADLNMAHIGPYQPIGNIFSANCPNYPDSTTMVEDPTSVAMGIDSKVTILWTAVIVVGMMDTPIQESKGTNQTKQPNHCHCHHQTTK